jgi:glycosyltransferase involved in cell wall biosynthesis
MKPEISVIIPTYNSANLIRRAINSVLGQTFQSFEIIVVDDGSTDGTEKIVRELNEKDERIIYLKLNKNSGGAAKPKNRGIKISKGDFIATLDADDEWSPEKLEKQLSIFKESTKKNLAFVGCFANHIYEEDGIKFLFKIPRHKNVLRYILARDYMGSGSSMLYKRKVFSEVGGFDENLRIGQDSEMRIRLAKLYDFDFVEEPLFTYYFHEKNITNSLSIEKRMKNIEYVIKKHKSLYSKYPKAYSDRLRFNGTSYIIAGEERLGRESFLESIRVNFFNWRSYLYWMVSFLGSNIYKRLTLLKSKIK